MPTLFFSATDDKASPDQLICGVSLAMGFVDLKTGGILGTECNGYARTPGAYGVTRVD